MSQEINYRLHRHSIFGFRLHSLDSQAWAALSGNSWVIRLKSRPTEVDGVRGWFSLSRRNLILVRRGSSRKRGAIFFANCALFATAHFSRLSKVIAFQFYTSSKVLYTRIFCRDKVLERAKDYRWFLGNPKSTSYILRYTLTSLFIKL